MSRRPSVTFRAVRALAAVGLLASCSAPLPTDSAHTDDDLADARRQPTGWERLSAPGTGPTGIKAVAHAPAQRAVFVSGVNGDFQPGTLWRFDLKRDRWTRMTAHDWPIGKYRKLIHDPVRRRLLTYWDGLGQVYSIPDTGGSWVPDGTSGNSELYYEAYAFFDPVASRLTVFGGYGWFAWQNLLWQWDDAQWVQVPPNGAVPAPRFGSANWVTVDAGGQRAFIVHRIADTNYDDLWRLDLVTGTWTELIPGSLDANTRMSSGLAYDAASATLYRFGGASWFAPTSFTNGLMQAKPDEPTVTWAPLVATGDAPSPRSGSALVHDAERKRLVMFSGSVGGDPSQWIDDVWAYRLR